MYKHVYIITGASSGLGAEITKQLLSEENYLFCISRTENADIIRQASGYRYKFYSIDLTDVEKLNHFFHEIIATIESSKIESITLINNAATVSPIKDIHYCKQEEIMANIQLNLTTPILLTSSFISSTSKWKVKRRIVNISSASAQYPAQSMSVYCSAKSALNMFSRCVGLEQKEQANAVEVFVVDPGMMDTELQRVARDSFFQHSEFFNQQKLEGKLAVPAHVASKILTIIKSSPIQNGDIHLV